MALPSIFKKYFEELNYQKIPLGQQYIHLRDANMRDLKNSKNLTQRLPLTYLVKFQAVSMTLEVAYERIKRVKCLIM